MGSGRSYPLVGRQNIARSQNQSLGDKLKLGYSDKILAMIVSLRQEPRHSLCPVRVLWGATRADRPPISLLSQAEDVTPSRKKSLQM